MRLTAVAFVAWQDHAKEGKEALRSAGLEVQHHQAAAETAGDGCIMMEAAAAAESASSVPPLVAEEACA